MFVAPVLVIISLFFQTSMPLLFTWQELIAMASSVLLIVVISNDGESNWFEGLTLIAAYVIMGIGFFLL
jgi:Ca2+:H+ antiporter